jgi:hypothetical protein
VPAWDSDETIAMMGSYKNSPTFPWLVHLTCQSLSPFSMSGIRYSLITVDEIVY